MTPMQMVKKFMGKNSNPQQVLMNIINKNNTNPMINNLMEMANKGNEQGIENFARNIFKERGRDFDKEFLEFMQNFKS